MIDPQMEANIASAPEIAGSPGGQMYLAQRDSNDPAKLQAFYDYINGTTDLQAQFLLEQRLNDARLSDQLTADRLAAEAATNAAANAAFAVGHAAAIASDLGAAARNAPGEAFDPDKVQFSFRDILDFLTYITGGK